MAKVLMLLSNPYRPDPRVRREAKALAGGGHQVTIAAWDRKGEKAPYEKDGPVQITRFGPHNDPKGAAAMAKGLPKFWKNVKKWALHQEWDVIHAHDFDTLPLGLKIGKKKKLPVLYDAHELYAEMVKEDVPGLLYKTISKKEKKNARKADYVITVNDAIAQKIGSWEVQRVGVVMNCPADLTPEVDDSPSLVTFPPEGFAVLYVGVLEPMRKLEDMVEGFATGKAPGMTLYIGGYGSIKEELEKKAGGAGSVKMLGRIPPDRVPAISREADILIALYDPNHTNNRLGAPNKLFEAMAYGKPIIVARGSWAGEVAEKTGCGVAVEYEGDELFSVLAKIRDNPSIKMEMGAKGLAASREQYNWWVMEKRLLDIYRELVS